MSRVDVGITNIDKHFILKYLTENEIFEKYLGISVDEESFFCNPLRNDKEAGCKFFYGDRTNKLWFIDFSRETFYDCFNVVQILYNCNYYQACKIIASDFGLTNTKQNLRPVINLEDIVKREKQSITLRVKAKTYFSKQHLDFWKKFNLPLSDEDLVNNLLVGGIRPIDTAWVQIDERLKTIYRYDKNKPGFVYELDDLENPYSYAFYFPYNERVKHIHSTTNTLHYYKNLPEQGEYMVITKSRKDSWLLLNFNIPTIGIMSERKMVSEEIMEDLQSRFKYVFTLFDNDRTGKILSMKMRKKYKTIPLMFDRELGKDFSDVLLNIGYQSMVQMVSDLKEEYYEREERFLNF